MWRGEWIEPNKKSYHIGYNEPDDPLMVLSDNNGEKIDLKRLGGSKYLWFKPELINDLLLYRGAEIKWDTKDTGFVSASPNNCIYFGVNKIGLINVLACDLNKLPFWEKQIWVGRNCNPDGGVSDELMDIQMACNRPSTVSPEKMLHDVLDWTGNIFKEKFNRILFRDHHELKELSLKIHRFRGIDESGLRSLAKDVCKFSIERIEKKSLMNLLDISQSNEGTLKLLQKLLNEHINDKFAYNLMKPLFGIYDIRNLDTHLASSDGEKYYKKLSIDRDQPLVKQAEQMIQSFAYNLGCIGNVIKNDIHNI